MRSDTARIVYLLCAHVRGDDWLCHRSTVIDNELDSANPLDEKDLVLKDIVRDVWEDEAPRKRIRAGRLSELRGLVGSVSWNTLLAVANHKAEEFGPQQRGGL